MECPFAEAGCTGRLVRRSQLEDHMTSSLQQHLMLVMQDSKETKRKLAKTEEKLNATKAELQQTKIELSVAMNHTCLSNMLIKNGDSVTLFMPQFPYYHYVAVERCI